MPNYETVDNYIAHQSDAVRPVLEELRSLLLEAAPDATEVLNCKVPTFTLVTGGKKDQQIMMAGYAHYVSFYPFPTTVEAFADELHAYKKGKGSIQFPLDQPLPKALIRRMVKFRKAEVLTHWKTS